MAATILDTPDTQGWCHVFALRMCGRPWRSVQWRLQVTHCQYSTLSCMKRSLAECSVRAAAQYLQIGGVRVMRRFSSMAVPEVTARQHTALKRVGHLSTVRRTYRFGVESTASIGWGLTSAWAAGSPRGICLDVSDWAVHAANHPTSPVNHLAGQQTCLTPARACACGYSLQRRRRALTTRVTRTRPGSGIISAGRRDRRIDWSIDRNAAAPAAATNHGLEVAFVVAAMWSHRLKSVTRRRSSGDHPELTFDVVLHFAMVLLLAMLIFWRF